MKNCSCSIRGALGVAVSLSLPIAAQAQAQPETGSGDIRILEEVVVTAQKVEQNLQDVPISVSVATEKDIAEISAFEFRDLAAITPGVDFGQAGVQNVAIRVRGVGPAFFALGTPPNVAVFVDQVGQAQIGAVFSTLVDIQRVELLRGPQGTLYGRNAPSGAYNITTNAPNYEGFNGYVEGSYSQFDSRDMATRDVRAAFNIPIVQDKLAWRIATVYSQSDGFVKMANPLADEDTTGGKDNKAIRSKLLWSATDAMDFTWTVNRQDLEQNPATFNYDGVVPGTGGSFPVPAITNEFEDRRNYGDTRAVVTGDIKDTSLHWRWDTGLFNLDVLGFYQDFSTINDQNRAEYIGGQEDFFIQLDSKLKTFEVRFSDSGDVLDYVAGLYYFDTDLEGVTDVFIPGNPSTGTPGAQVNILTEGKTSGYAVFGNVNFHLADKWDLAVGLRYDRNTDDLFVDGDVAGFVGLDIQESDLEFDHVSWSVKLRNYITDNMTAYVALDHAYKQGGFNPFVAGAADLAGRLPGSVTPEIEQAIADSFTYDEETSDAFEIGFKGGFLNNQLRLGTAIFYQRFNDHQVAQTNQGIPALDQGAIGYSPFFTTTITNAERVDTRGVEFDLAYLFASYWDVAWRMAYADPTVDEWSSRYCPADEAGDPPALYCPQGDGEPLNNLPKWNSNLQLGYSAPMAGRWDFYSRVSWTWQSKPADNRVTDIFAEDKSLFGLNFGFRESQLGLDIKFWGKNLTNTQTTVDPGQKNRVDDGVPGAYVGNFTPGREYGITLRYNF